MVDVLPNEEEELLRSSVRQFLEEQCSTRLVRQMEQDELGYPPELWKQMADLGWFGWILPSQYGGSEGTLIQLGIILNEVGRALAPVPFLTTMVPAMAVMMEGTDEQKQQILPAVANGDMILTYAFYEHHPRLTPDKIQTTATAQGDEYVISGKKMFVESFVAAQKCLVAARTPGTSGRDGISLFLVDTNASGISHTKLTTIAKDHQYAVDFENVRTSKSNLVGAEGQGWQLIEKLTDRATALICAQILGAARKAMELAVEWSKYRIAFGRPIGSFQSLSHMLVDQLIHIDGGELLTYEALWRLDNDLPAQVEVSAAKAFTNDKALSVFRGANVVHGGISFIREFDLNLWFRKGSEWTMKLGTTVEHRARVADALLAPRA
jgi:alkylation response protein AidB-like acyl-CoA dehydrogenase